jgi:hypothetical protein
LVRLVSLLFRPDLAVPWPWRGAQGLEPRRADQGSGATRSHAQRGLSREHGEDGEHH